jgi:hypothetical protein
MRHGCKMLGIIVLLVAAIDRGGAAPDMEEIGFRYQLPRDWEKNKALLKEDVVDLEMRVGDTRKVAPAVFVEKGYGERETLGQMLGAVFRLEIAEGLVLTQRLDLSMARMEYQNYTDETGSVYDQWTQAHVTNLRWDVSPSLTLEGFSELRQMYRSDLDNWQELNKYGVAAAWRGPWKTGWNVRAWSDERSDRWARLTRTDALLASMDYTVRPGTSLRPEILLEERTDYLERVTERTTASLGLSQRVYKSYVSASLKPGVTWETYPETPQYDREYRNMDASVRWTPLPGLAVVTGMQLRQRLDPEVGAAEWMRNVYCQVDHKAGEDFNMRLRSDYLVTERKTQEYWEEANSKVRVSLGPQWQLSETVTAGAEYRYLNDYRGPYAEPLPIEQVIALSLSSEF